jgi:hypothetical protein
MITPGISSGDSPEDWSTAPREMCRTSPSMASGHLDAECNTVPQNGC